MADKPLWRRTFDVFERPVSGALDRVIQTDAYAHAVSVSWKLALRFRRDFERNSERFLHLWNLPAGTDVDRLLTQVAKVERQVRDLSRELDGDARHALAREFPEGRPSKREDR